MRDSSAARGDRRPFRHDTTDRHPVRGHLCRDGAGARSRPAGRPRRHRHDRRRSCWLPSARCRPAADQRHPFPDPAAARRPDDPVGAGRRQRLLRCRRGWIAGQAGRPLRLLALTIAVGGVLSALLVNDIVVFAMTPLLCAGLTARNLDPRPFLFGLAAASNAGSAATLIGNPQNILIGQAGNIGFWPYFADAAVPSLVGACRSASDASPWSGARAWPRPPPTRRCAGRIRPRPGRHLRHRARRAAGAVCHAAAARDLGAAGRRLPDRQPRAADPAIARRDRPAAADPVRGAVRGQRRLRPHRPAGGGRASARLARPAAGPPRLHGADRAVPSATRSATCRRW